MQLNEQFIWEWMSLCRFRWNWPNAHRVYNADNGTTPTWAQTAAMPMVIFLTRPMTFTIDSDYNAYESILRLVREFSGAAFKNRQNGTEQPNQRQTKKTQKNEVNDQNADAFDILFIGFINCARSLALTCALCITANICIHDRERERGREAAHGCRIERFLGFSVCVSDVHRNNWQKCLCFQPANANRTKWTWKCGQIVLVLRMMIIIIIIMFNICNSARHTDTYNEPNWVAPNEAGKVYKYHVENAIASHYIWYLNVMYWKQFSFKHTLTSHIRTCYSTREKKTPKAFHA